jgi:hypothetical protein
MDENKESDVMWKGGCSDCHDTSAGFTYRLDRLKPRDSKFRGPPAKVYNIFNTVIRNFCVCLMPLSAIFQLYHADQF